MLKRWMLVGFLTLLCAGIVSGVYFWLTYQEDRITDENYLILFDMQRRRKLELADVEAVLGRPADHYGRLRSEWKSFWGNTPWWEIEARDGWRSWIGRKRVIHVLVGVAGCSMSITVLPEETFWDRVRRLCPWIERVW